MSKMIIRSLIIIFALTGLMLGLGINEGKFYIDRINYYTYVSVIVVFVYYFYLLLAEFIPKLKTKFVCRCKGAVTTMIMVTFIVYLLGVIAGVAKTALHLQNILLHFVVPTLCVLEEIFFTCKNVYKKKDFFKYPVVQITYGVCIYTEVEVLGYSMPSRQSRYPYDLIDPSIVGWRLVVVIVAVILLVLLIGRMIYKINKKLVK